MIEFSTAAMPSREGRRAWGDRLAAVCGRPAAMRYPHEDFMATIKLRDVGGINIAQFSHNICEIEQTHLPQTSPRGRYMMLVMQLRGQSLVSQYGREMPMSPGEMAVIDSSRPFVSRFAGLTTQLIAYLPAAELAPTPTSSFSEPKSLSGREGIGVLARSTLLTIARSADRFDDDDAAHARDMLTGVVRRLFDRERRRGIESAHDAPDRRIRAFIEAHLADPELSPTQIAAGCGISVRRLHRAFADTEWSVCGWIRWRRLERCRQDLLDPARDGMSITQIAYRWGFNDAAHFSRSFREAYNTSPRNVRKQGGVNPEAAQLVATI